MDKLTKNNAAFEVRHLIRQGVYDQNVIFNTLYPIYHGHYSQLREIIAAEKDR